jgi:chromosome segregation ATPase
MSIDGRGSSLSRSAQDTISALKSKLRRANERIAVLEMLVQSTSDDRDGYLERAVELQQLISGIDGALTGLQLKYKARDLEEFTGESVSALDAVNDCMAAFQKVTASEAGKEPLA